ncbi:unnamed protein product [Dovyalis caffra]|uniref:Uncharacterized protein n=1 Tax=Dovyalis caffra TaxID=77055 RepID=A0AAV1R597_9ROSI|nr:unnamed protein product [Dovyalis caffra]
MPTCTNVIRSSITLNAPTYSPRPYARAPHRASHPHTRPPRMPMPRLGLFCRPIHQPGTPIYRFTYPHPSPYVRVPGKPGPYSLRASASLARLCALTRSPHSYARAP